MSQRSILLRKVRGFETSLVGGSPFGEDGPNISVGLSSLINSLVSPFLFDETCLKIGKRKKKGKKVREVRNLRVKVDVS